MGNYSAQERECYLIFSKLYACQLEWAEMEVMRQEEFRKLEGKLANLEKEIGLLKIQQPDCSRNPETYEDEFFNYCEKVSKIIDINNHECYQIKHHLFSREKIEDLRYTLDTLTKLRNAKWPGTIRLDAVKPG